MAELVAEPGMCEEARMGYAAYIPCNKSAIVLVGWPSRGEGPYRMCLNCADHNIQNRDARSFGMYTPKAQQELRETFKRGHLNQRLQKAYSFALEVLAYESAGFTEADGWYHEYWLGQLGY